jgi:putative hemolysin
MNALLPLVVLFLSLLILSAFFSCSETAFFSLTRVELSSLRRRTAWASRRLVALLREPRDTLVGILLGNEVVNCTIAIVGAQIVVLFIDNRVTAVVVAVMCVTPLVLIFGEVLPKNIAVGLALKISPYLSAPMSVFLWITTPIRWVLMQIADSGIRLFRGDPTQVRAMIFEEEFRSLVTMGEESGALSASEREWIHGVFSFTDMTVRDVMTPIDEVFRIPLSWPIEKILEEVRQVQFSRIPVYHENPNDVVGLLYVRDLITYQSRRERGMVGDLEELVRPVLFVAETTRVEPMLKEFQRTKIHLAVLRNAKQQMVGLITLDDLIDAFIGVKEETR